MIMVLDHYHWSCGVGHGKTTHHSNQTHVTSKLESSINRTLHRRSPSSLGAGFGVIGLVVRVVEHVPKFVATRGIEAEHGNELG